MSALPGLPAAGVVFDLEGTLYRSEEAIPGAVATVARLRAAGVPVRFLTNTTSRSRRGLGDKLRGMGFAAGDDEVLTGVSVAADFVRAQGGSAWLLLPEAAHEDFDGVPRDEQAPDWIVIGDLGHDWSFEILNRAFVAVKERGARLVAVVRSRYWKAPAGLQLDAGPFVAALEYATDTRAVTCGKPEPEAFLAAARSIGVSPGRVLMVGDDPDTDVAAACRAGLRGALVLTGKVTDAVAARRLVDAEVAVLRSVAELEL